MVTLESFKEWKATFDAERAAVSGRLGRGVEEQWKGLIMRLVIQGTHCAVIRAMGTMVTPENFKEWKAKFDAERAAVSGLVDLVNQGHIVQPFVQWGRWSSLVEQEFWM